VYANLEMTDIIVVVVCEYVLCSVQ